MPQTSKEERAQWAELCVKAPGQWHLRQVNVDFATFARTALPRLLADYVELEQSSERDYAEMRRFQELYMKADHAHRELERKVREWRDALDAHYTIEDAYAAEAALRAAVEGEK